MREVNYLIGPDSPGGGLSSLPNCNRPQEMALSAYLSGVRGLGGDRVVRRRPSYLSFPPLNPSCFTPLLPASLPVCSDPQPLTNRDIMNSLNRREFAKTIAVARATTAFGGLNILGANERVRLGFIGLGNRGDQVLDAFLKHPDCQVLAICDLFQPYLDFAAKKIGTQPKQFRDYRRLLEEKDIDAVVICTPDHWHALQTVHACEAGKDVYVEKPLSLRVAEGRKMVAAVRKHKRVSQVGIHRRSIPFCQELAEFIRNGGIGKVTVARAFHIQNEWPKGIGNPPNGEPPAGLDWEAWLGPAPKVAFNKNRGFYRFRWFYDYSGGQVTNFGVHYLDLIRPLGQDAPLAVTAMGGKIAIEDNREIPDTSRRFGGILAARWSPFRNSTRRLPRLRRARPKSSFEALKGRCMFLATATRSWRISWRSTRSLRVHRSGGTGSTVSRGRANGDRTEEGEWYFQRGYGGPRAQFPRLHKEPPGLHLRHRDRPSEHNDDAAGQYRI